MGLVDLPPNSLHHPGMDRRHFLLTSLAGALAAPLAGEAQQRGKVHRLGLLGNATLTDANSKALSEGLRDLGWIEGQNFVWERRFSEGRNERFPSLAAELVQTNPDVIISAGTAATVAAKAATTTIPIVFLSVGDPVGSGIVASLARPGGIATGLGGLGPGLHAKMLALFKEALPSASRFGVFVNSNFSLHAAYRAEMEPVARTLNVALVLIEVQAHEQLDGAVATAAKEKVHGVVVLGQPMMFALRARLAKLALDHFIPAIIVWYEAVDAGVLMSYGDRAVDQWRRVPYYVDRILKGARPSDLPIEQASRFYLHINQKTARALGLAIPPSLLARADQIIE
jgi:putative tryptophan/tyrosine transport system substrate-binding protein